MESNIYDLAEGLTVMADGMTMSDVLGDRKIKQTTIINPQLILHHAVRGLYNLAYDMDKNGRINSLDGLMLLQSGKTFYSLPPYDDNTEDYDVLPMHLRTKIKFIFPGGIEHEFSAPEIIGKRISVDFLSASGIDYDIYNLSNPSDYTVTPTLGINSEPVLSGTDTTLGKAINLTIKVSRPGNGGRWDETTKHIVAGGRYNIVVALQKIPLELAKEASAKLKSEMPDMTEIEAMDESLHVAGLFYYGMYSTYDKTISKSLNIHSSCCVSIGFVSREIVPMISSTTGKVVEIRKGGVVVDIPVFTVAPISFTEETENQFTYMRTMGLFGSSLEHATVEILFGIDAISTVKGFYEATRQGIPIITLDDQARREKQLATITAHEHIKTTIRNYMKKGYIAIIPKDNITLNGWTGQTWIVYDPETGSAGYMIEGGLNGGEATAPITEQIFDVATTVADKTSGTADAMIVGGSMVIAAGAKVASGVSHSADYG